MYDNFGCHGNQTIFQFTTIKENEPAHDKTYNKTCANSEDSDQSAHPCSLIRIFADCMFLQQPTGYPKRDKLEPFPYWVDIQADLSLCWSHKSDYCRICHALDQISIKFHLNLFRGKI